MNRKTIVVVHGHEVDNIQELSHASTRWVGGLSLFLALPLLLAARTAAAAATQRQQERQQEQHMAAMPTYNSDSKQH